MTKLTVAFRNFGNAPKNEPRAVLQQVEHGWADLLSVVVLNIVVPCRSHDCSPCPTHDVMSRK